MNKYNVIYPKQGILVKIPKIHHNYKIRFPRTSLKYVLFRASQNFISDACDNGNMFIIIILEADDAAKV